MWCGERDNKDFAGQLAIARQYMLLSIIRSHPNATLSSKLREGVSVVAYGLLALGMSTATFSTSGDRPIERGPC